MDKFIKVTVADGCKALVPVGNIQYVAELTGYEKSKATIYFKAGNKIGFNVLDSIDEIAAKIEALTKDKD